MRRTPFAAVVLLLASSVALGGCVSSAIERGTDAPTATSQEGEESATASPETGDAATGERVSGDGYSLIIPVGWETHPDMATGQGIDLIAADASAATDAATANLNVILSPAGAVTKEQVEAVAPGELENAGATNVRAGEAIEVDGVESLSLAADFVADAGNLAIVQTYLLAPDQAYIVTFTFPGDTSEADQWALIRSVLGSWEWDG